LFVATFVIGPETLTGTDLGVPGYLTVPDPGGLEWVEPVIGAGLSVTYGAALASLVLRYRRGTEQVRRQLLWLLLAVLLMVTGFIVSDLLHFENVLTLIPVALVPLSITVALLRHQLLDIRLVVSRSVSYLLLTGGAVAAYVALVAGFDTVLRRQVGLGSSVLATLLVAAAFNPVRVWLQRRIDRTFYGARQDPVRAIAEVGARLGNVGNAAGTGLAGVLEALCQVMRFPSASVVAGGTELTSYGDPPAVRQSIPLRQGGDELGELVIGLRSGETRLDTADERVLACSPLRWPWPSTPRCCPASSARHASG
jgi:two-component system NarL family sensor kinase